MSDIAGSRSNGTVDGLLHESGLDDDAVLRAALQDLRGLADVQPEPSAAVAALMVPAATRRLAAVPAPTRHLAAVSSPTVSGTPEQATDELAARRRAKRRITLTTLSVAVSLAAGGAVAVASDQGIRDSLGQVSQAVSSFVATAGGGSAPAPAQTPAPQPAQPVGPATVPAAPSSTAPGQTPPESGSGNGTEDAPGQSGPAPAGPLPDLTLPADLPTGVPGLSDGLRGEGQPPALPLPSNPPVPLPGVHP